MANMNRLVALHGEPLQCLYKAPRLSWAYLFHVSVTVMALLGPLLLAFPTRSEGGTFWKLHSTYREQPVVGYQYKLIVELQAVDRNTGLKYEIYYSTIDAANLLMAETGSFRMADVTVSSQDDNLDGLTDRFHITSEIPLGTSEDIVGIKALALFDYSIHHRAKIKIDGIAYVSHESGDPGSSFILDGTFRFQQIHPLEIRPILSRPYDGENLINLKETATSIGEASVEDIIRKRYSSRSLRADLEKQFTSWRRAHSDQPHSSFKLELKLDVPVQDFIYTPPFIEVMKDAWMKYVSLFIPIAIILRQFCEIVYHNQLVQTIISKP